MSAQVAAGYGLVSLASLAVACRRVRATRDSKSALLGVSAAFIFAAQLVNFPVVAGTSGHLVGGALAAILVGLPSSVIVMSSVLFVQCFVFGDGGVLALGANAFNMGLVSCLTGYCCYRLLCGSAPSSTRRVACAAFAAWCATVAAAASCATQLALSGAARLSLVLPALLGVHALIGAGEALISALVVASVLRFRPELLEFPDRAQPTAGLVAGLARHGLGLALAVAGLLGPLACAAPDGLTRVLLQLGLRNSAPATLSAPLAEYAVPGLGSGALATILAGVLGVLLLFGLCWLLALGLVPRSRHASEARERATVESLG